MSAPTNSEQSADDRHHPARRRRRANQHDSGQVRILTQDVIAAQARAHAALRQIIEAVDQPEVTQSTYHLVCFLASCYDGLQYPMNPAAFRELPPTLAQACLDYLNFDRLGTTNVVKLLRGGETWLRQWIGRYQLSDETVTLRV